MSNQQTKVELFFEAKGLRNADFLGKSDPMVIVSLNSTGARFEEVWRSECKQDTLNPKWDESLTLPYSFQEEQTLRIQVVDVDGDPAAAASTHDDLGSVDVPLGTLIQKGRVELSLPKGTLTVTLEKVEDSHEICSFQISATKIKKMDLFSQSDGFLEISRSTGDEKTAWVLVHTTEVKEKNANPDWRPFTLTASELCNSDHLRDLRFECYDSDGPGKKQLIGSFTTTLRDLARGTTTYTLRSAKGKDHGTVHFNEFRITKVPSFTDFLQAGMQMAVEIYVDFTGSNGNPSKPTSLHYYASGTTQYEDAALAVARVVAPYDSDGGIDMYGFGGVFQNGRTSHCHSLGEAKDVEDISRVYRETLRTVTLSGPTYFREIIEKAAQAARERTNTYTIMVILCDGGCNDLTKVKAALRQSSDSPISVVIVGIGQADFSAMQDLDDLDDEEVSRCRDLVQFVPFSKYQNNPRLLASAVLAEVPEQVESWHQHVRKAPVDYSTT